MITVIAAKHFVSGDVSVEIGQYDTREAAEAVVNDLMARSYVCEENETGRPGYFIVGDAVSEDRPKRGRKPRGTNDDERRSYAATD